MKVLVGNSFQIKDKIKAAGGKWDGRFWSVPDHLHSEFQKELGEVQFLFENRRRRGPVSHRITKVSYHPSTKSFFVVFHNFNNDNEWLAEYHSYGHAAVNDLCDTEEELKLIDACV